MIICLRKDPKIFQFYLSWNTILLFGSLCLVTLLSPSGVSWENENFLLGIYIWPKFCTRKVIDIWLLFSALLFWICVFRSSTLTRHFASWKYIYQTLQQQSMAHESENFPSSLFKTTFFWRNSQMKLFSPRNNDLPLVLLYAWRKHTPVYSACLRNISSLIILVTKPSLLPLFWQFKRAWFWFASHELDLVYLPVILQSNDSFPCS